MCTIQRQGGHFILDYQDICAPSYQRCFLTRFSPFLLLFCFIPSDLYPHIPRQLTTTPFYVAQVMNTNLKSAFLLSQAAGAHMLPRRCGSIIHFASLLSFQGGLTVPAYAAAKGGIAQMVKALANEWSKDNVRVNAVAPGYIKTDM